MRPGQREWTRMHDPFAPREAQARVLQVIEVSLVRGKGVEGDPVRRVLAYFDLDGDFLAERDDVPVLAAEKMQEALG